MTTAHILNGGWIATCDTAETSGIGMSRPDRKMPIGRLLDTMKPRSRGTVDGYLAGYDAATPGALDVAGELQALLPLLMARGAATDIAASELTDAGLVTPADVLRLLCARLGIECDPTPAAGIAALHGYVAAGGATGQDAAAHRPRGQSVKAYLGIGADAAPAPRPPINRNPPHRVALPSSQVGDYLNGIG